MNGEGYSSVIGSAQYQMLQRTVFSQKEQAVFAVLDGALIDGLPERLRRDAPDAMCLFSGRLDPMLEAAAPHLVPLQPDTPAAHLALRDGWNDHWGIVLVANPGTDIHTMRAHLRRNLRVAVPGGASVFFRFYDPRAFRNVIPTLKGEHRTAFYGPIQGCYVEGRSPESALFFSRDNVRETRTVALAAAA